MIRAINRPLVVTLVTGVLLLIALIAFPPIQGGDSGENAERPRQIAPSVAQNEAGTRAGDTGPVERRGPPVAITPGRNSLAAQLERAEQLYLDGRHDDARAVAAAFSVRDWRGAARLAFWFDIVVALRQGKSEHRFEKEMIAAFRRGWTDRRHRAYVESELIRLYRLRTENPTQAGWLECVEALPARLLPQSIVDEILTALRR